MNITKLSQIVAGKLPYQNINRDSVVLIGRSDNGPRMIPIGFKDIDKVIDMFGYDSELTNAYLEAKQAGASDIYLIKINGQEASIIINDALKITSIEASILTNDISCQIETTGFKRNLHISNNITGETITYLLNDKDLTDIENEINRDAYSGVGIVYAETLLSGTTDLLLDCDLIYLAGGEDYANPDPEVLYDRMCVILDYLSSIQISQLGLVYGNIFNYVPGKKHPYQVLYEFANDKAINSMPCFINAGAIDTDVLEYDTLYDFANRYDLKNSIFKGAGQKSLTLPVHPVDERVDVYKDNHKISEYLFEYNTDTITLDHPIQGEEVIVANYRVNTFYYYEKSPYINIILGRFNIAGTYEEYISNGVAAYTGMISSLKTGEPTTGKSLIGATTSKQFFTDKELKSLSNLGYVVIVEDSKVYKGTNLLANTSLLGNTSNVHLVQDISLKLYETINPLIGNSIDINNLSILIDGILKQYPGMLKTYSFSIERVSEKYTNDYLINIDITPYGEVDNLSFAVSVW